MILDPKPEALRPHTSGGPDPDRVDESRAQGTPEPLRQQLCALLGEDKVLHKISDLVRFASDASPYRFVPQAVVLADGIEDISDVFGFAHAHGRNIVFRAGGTSLNGQAQAEDIMVEVRRHWTGVEMLPDSARARIRPGTTIARINATISRHGRVMGPDPASSIAATLGGTIANNASGMTAGTTRNCYRTMASVTVVLPSGTIIDTGHPQANEHLRAAEPEIYQGLLDIKAEIESDPSLVDLITTKYTIKNTNGYRLDSFLDADTPAQILRGLMVGSEGTLGFIAEAVFDTLPLERRTSTALLFFPDLQTAAAAVPAFNDAGARAVELMDGNTLRACAVVEGVPDDWATLPKDTTSLLVEFRSADEETQLAQERAAEEVLAGLPLVRPVPSVTNLFTRDARTIHMYWRAREAFAAAVGKARAPGTTLISEDFAVPPHRLAEACADLLALQAQHGFDAAVSGHAAHGNLHFGLAFDSADPAEVDRYAAFMNDFCTMTVQRYNGSLKAEHATGRNITPFLELEWGAVATDLMWRIKALIDPKGILAPRVILNKDPRAHLHGLKSIPSIEPVADSCIECGFCEPVCPSHDLTTSPRQRIVLRREMMRQDPNGSAVLDSLVDSYGYDAVDTCAGDSTCAIACPVGIDTGAYMKDFRHQRHSAREERVAEITADRFALLESGARLALIAGSHLPDSLLTGVTRAARKVIRPDLVPEWLPGTPTGAGRTLPRTDRVGAAAVYYTACVNRIFAGPDKHEMSVAEAVVEVSRRAGLPVWLPDDMAGSCCATIWHSKGYVDGNTLMGNRIIERAWEWTDHGRLPLVVDASSCTLGIAKEIVPYLTEENLERHRQLTVIDSIVWASDHLLPALSVTSRIGSAVIHPTCSMRHLGVVDNLREVAEACADGVTLPVWAECCGFAGDRGMLHKELPQAASAHEAAEVLERDYDSYVSANRTCEVGMEYTTGKPFHSVLIDLERATREIPAPAAPPPPAS
ncbi:oxidoreductase [Streptomyces sulfonofaciens]|uniref:D-lactate dehydrogenase (cytochrome) n=1 Tax=Streptomyces sulfonofaciens TaxID=68272 RepID=A0A919GR55_9ACTN|nr:FAD-binding and (Fe-S)-binding domain-containing protein [Streptomyces sulfonofaciens]GHH88728.1 oxidoreductase [Streptomyces sulfonofaciens]